MHTGYKGGIFFSILGVVIVGSGLIASRPMTDSGPALPTGTAPNEPYDHSRIEFRENLRQGILPTYPSGISAEESGEVAAEAAVSISTPVNWSRLAYQVVYDDQYEIVVQDGAGQNDVRLTFDPGNDIEPRFNPSATDIVFASDRDGDFEIYRMKADGSQLQQLTNNTNRDLKPAWSPDGTKIVFTSNMPYSNRYQIWSMNADGTGLVQLTTGTGVNYYDPAWSPDGTQIAYVRVDSDHVDEIYVMNGNGSNPHMACNGHNANMSYELYDIADLVWGDYPNVGNRISFDYYPYGEYFSKFGAYTPSTGACGGGGYTAGQTLTDVLNGGYSPDGLEVLVSEIRWTESGGYLYFLDMRSFSYCLAGYGNCGRPPIGRTYSLMPEWKSFDHWPAVSTITPLPAFSRGIYPIGVNAYDIGPAGLANWQYRYLTEGDLGEEWSAPYIVNPLSFHAHDRSASYESPAIYQTRACDDASQCEDWSSDPNHQTQTQKYTWQINGSIHDNRGYPDLTSSVVIDPLPVLMEENSSTASYHALMNTTGTHTLTLTSDGYLTPPGRSFELNIDRVFNDYLLPKINAILNGNADGGGIDPWVISGSLPASISNIEAVSGSNSFMLGSDCGGICLEVIETLPSPLSSGTVRDILRDENGGIHLISSEYQTDTHLYNYYYYYRSPEGVWNPKEIAKPDNSGSSTLELDIDRGGKVYLIIPSWTGNRIVARDPDGNWTEVVLILNETLKAHATDQDGSLHLITTFRDNYSITHLYDRVLTDGGVLLPAIELIWDWGLIDASTPVLDSLNNLHLLYSTDYDDFYQVRNADGIWEPRDPLLTGTYGYGTVIPAADKTHFFGPSSYAYTSEGVVTPPVNFQNTGSWANLLGPDGVLWHFFTLGGPAFQKLAPGQPWGKPQSLASQPGYIFLDDRNIFHAFQGNAAYQYLRSEMADNDGDATLTQVVEIPADMNHPTLSFMEQISGGVGMNGTGLQVNIIDGETTSTVFSDINRNTLWEHQWVDLSAYAGHTVSVQFKLDQKAGDPVIHIDLDDISLGAWDTPIVLSSSPAGCSAMGSTVTIHGENLLEGATVYLDELPLDPAAVSWQDNQTLVITLAPDYPLGMHPLRIMNPAGQVTPASYLVYVGCSSFLPVVQR